MSMFRICSVALLPAILMACAGEDPASQAIAEVDSPEALAAQVDPEPTDSISEEFPGDEPTEAPTSEQEPEQEPSSEPQDDVEDPDLSDETSEDVCRPEMVNLEDFEAWRREAGFWVGEYTLLGADGNPSASSSWPYRYDHYRGFIHLEVIGNAIKQRNVFVYPPQNPDLCTGEEGEVVGDGACGVNGNEKVFSADQEAADCSGNLAGPYVAYGMEMNTATTILGDDTVLYQVRMPDGSLMQNQLTSLPGNDTRVRTAQGFYMGNPTYASYYRERKVTRDEFFALLEETRTEYGILEEDYCGRDSSGAETNLSCMEHFDLTVE